MSYYQVLDVPQNNPCNHCNPCMRMKLMELGFIEGQEIEVEEKMRGMFIVNMLSVDGYVEQTIALRKEELGRICLKEI
jgi:Fe2+ transport system protein FeoA